MFNHIEIQPIGIIRSPFTNKDEVPIQSIFSETHGRVIVDEKYMQGLKDIEHFSHLYLIYHFNREEEPNVSDLTVKPFLDETRRGIFATRYAKRPNRIGISIVNLERVENNILHVSRIDILDKTPLLDIKPYIPEFDSHAAKTGWIRGKIKK